MKPFRYCFAIFFAVCLFCHVTHGQDWNQWLGSERDGVWRDKEIITTIPAEGLKELWRVPIAAGFAGPAVAENRVYVTDYVLKEGKRLFNPGKRSELKGSERLHCLDAKTGKEFWKYEYECDYNMSYALGPRKILPNSLPCFQFDAAQVSFDIHAVQTQTKALFEGHPVVWFAFE